MSRISRLAFAILGLTAAVVSTEAANSTVLTAEGRDYFEKHIRPVLVAECYDCHAGSKKKGGLVLDSREGLLRGGDSGPSLIPGDPWGSLLIQSLSHQHKDVDLHMPKDGAKLDEVTLQHFVTWVKMGAPDPRDKPAVAEGQSPVSWDQVFESRRKWWSLQPLQRGLMPPANGERHPVDAFIKARLDKEGLAPAPEADRRVLIRRLSFALTGLPPKPEEVRNFLDDDSPQAWDKVVDHYLAQPAYGETWARRWMDLMRYAETHGSEGDPAIPGAWYYRDHLIRAFNSDVPYNRMVQEHLAGDLLKPRWDAATGVNESLLATAHLRLVEHGFQPVDSLDEQVKMVDNQIDVVTKSFLGLTVSCARCHDHKFDAISQEDFFALYGIFASTRPGQVVIDRPEVLGRHRDELAGLKSGIKAELVRLWLAEAESVPGRLLQQAQHESGEDDPAAPREGLRATARARVLEKRGTPVRLAALAPEPLAAWSFEGDARDQQGKMHGELVGGAVVRDGRLVLNGESAYVRTAPLSKDVTARTLEAWVRLDDLNQRGGGVVTVETAKGDVFDAIVLGERRAQEWLAGSDHHRRTRDFGGEPESESGNKLIHLALVYGGDNSVTMYRNGEPYGRPYVAPAEMETYRGGNGHVLIGKRHLGGGNSFLKGEIEEARLYDQALTPSQVASSYAAGVERVREEELLAALSPAERQEYDRLTARMETLERERREDATGLAWKAALEEGDRDKAGLLHPWSRLRHLQGEVFRREWARMREAWHEDLAARRKFNETNYVKLWDVSRPEHYAAWRGKGSGLPGTPSGPGGFMVEVTGENVISGLLPAGVYSPLLTARDAALLVSPFFKMEADHVSVQITGDAGGGVRLMVDNYPLGNNNTYPQFRPSGEPLKWVRLDTSYRRGAQAYVELSTRDDSTRPQPPSTEPVKKGGKPAEHDGRSWFGLAGVVLHKDGVVEPPKSETLPESEIWKAGAPADAVQMAHLMAGRLREAIVAWREERLSADQFAYLNAFVTAGLLSVEAEASAELDRLVKTYREVEARVPVARRAPGPVEADGRDAPFMPRGDHLQPGKPVARRFLSALGGNDCRDAGSGRLQLAEAMTQPGNPLLSRVMVNRIWHWLFGRGLVGTVDNFGRLGDKPTHPELLDYLAARFEKEGWSVKSMIRLMVTSETWRQSSDASEATLSGDAANQWFSRARVQRLEAEMIRDAMLQVSGVLDPAMYGEPVGDAQRRRSIYLRERRTAPHAFLEVFDRPKPTTTRGQRDATNIPAQSLAMMNDRFVIDLAQRWAARVARQGGGDSFTARLEEVHESALGRAPTPEEVALAREYFAGEDNEAVWRDYLQAVFALKEFIYLR